MNSGICFLVLGFIPLVLSNGGSLLHPCRVHDIECLSHATEKFLENTCKGIPTYDIRAIDPIIIPGPLVYKVDDGMNLVFRFKNLNVTGLKNQKISDFQMDLMAQSVLLKTKVDLNVVGDITIELSNSKTFSGVYHSSGTVLGTARYNYKLEKDAKDVEHFVVGPETLTCETIDVPIVMLDKELDDALKTDPDTVALQPAYESNKTSHRKRAFCKIAGLAYIDVVHNIRAAAKLLPKTDFFVDV